MGFSDTSFLNPFATHFNLFSTFIGAGDKPARDQLQIRLEERRRAGKLDGPVKYSQIRRKKKSNK